MYTNTDLFDMEKFVIQKTNVCHRGLAKQKQEVVDFIKRIVNEDILKIVLEEIV